MYFCRPNCPMGTFPYTIMAGDTLYSIAMRYNTNVNEIMRVNPCINPYCLRIGQMICVPMPPMPRPCPAGTFPYDIEPGDTFYSIGRKFNVSVADLALANPGVDPNNLQIGQRICVPEVIIVPPSDCPTGTFSYTIRSGDTFYRLSQLYNTTVEAIQAANPTVDPDNLQIGQVICIPEATSPDCPTGTFSYTIRCGDIFYNLAKKYSTTVEAIQAANPNVNPDNLQIGQKICIPRT